MDKKIYTLENSDKFVLLSIANNDRATTKRPQNQSKAKQINELSYIRSICRFPSSFPFSLAHSLSPRLHRVTPILSKFLISFHRKSLCLGFLHDLRFIARTFAENYIEYCLARISHPSPHPTTTQTEYGR